MAEDIVKKSGTLKGYKDDRGGAVLIPHPVIGIVKDNIDPAHAGRIKVYIARFGNSEPNDSKSWLTVKYLSPYFGTIAPKYDVYSGTDNTGNGKFLGNPHSYGFWASAPDIGSQVVCVFINGNPQDGYYIGCAPHLGLSHMVPAVGASSLVVPNAGEAESYGGADRLPVTEANYSNKSIRTSSKIFDVPKPVHSYQASILFKQGLIRDNIRGVISSSSQRETPSKVFGISTPGQAIYQGGYTNSTIKSAASSADTSKLQVIGRTGGHSIVLDDGTLNGEDQLVRIRTSAGHTIMMSDSGQCLTIIHSNGQSWIELGSEGTVDVFSTNSVNIRTQGDLNLHADQDVNIHAGRNLKMFASDIKIEAEQNASFRTGGNFTGYHMGKFTVKVDQQMSMESNGDSMFSSGAKNYIVGTKVMLNTGASPLTPQYVPEMDRINHVDTTFSSKVGWMNPSPQPLISITTRTPAHMPWAEANKGVSKES